MSSTKFQEHLRFRQYDVLAATLALLGAAAYATVATALAPTSAPLKLVALALVSGALLARVVYLLRVRQETRVTRKNLKVRLRAFLGMRERIPLDEIEECAVVRYPPFAQRYGRGGWLSGERFLSLVGRNGVAIRTKDGEAYFVGTRRPRELAAAINAAA